MRVSLPHDGNKNLTSYSRNLKVLHLKILCAIISQILAYDFAYTLTSVGSSDVVDLGVHEDVVDVQLHVRDLLGGINDRAGGEHGGHRDIGGNGRDTDGGSGTLGDTNSGVLLNGETREAVAGGDEDDVVLVLNVNRDETLTIGNRDRGDRETGITVEPEDHILVYPLACNAH